MIKPFAFVVMPFKKEFDDIYQLGILSACKALGIHAERLDNQIFKENMLEHIYKEINRADIIIAEMTGLNPNVFYEVGYAHGINQVVIPITKNSDDIPFDLRLYPHIVYDSISALKSELKRRLRHFIQNRRLANLYQCENINVFIDGKRLNKKLVEIDVERDSYIDFELILDVTNEISSLIRKNDIKFGLIASTKDLSPHDFGSLELIRIKMPNDKELFMQSDLITINPGEWKKINMRFYCSEYCARELMSRTITIRLFHENGYIDFPVKPKFRRNKESRK